MPLLHPRTSWRGAPSSFCVLGSTPRLGRSSDAIQTHVHRTTPSDGIPRQNSFTEELIVRRVFPFKRVKHGQSRRLGGTRASRPPGLTPSLGDSFSDALPPGRLGLRRLGLGFGRAAATQGHAENGAPSPWTPGACRARSSGDGDQRPSSKRVAQPLVRPIFSTANADAVDLAVHLGGDLVALLTAVSSSLSTSKPISSCAWSPIGAADS